MASEWLEWKVDHAQDLVLEKNKFFKITFVNNTTSGVYIGGVSTDPTEYLHQTSNLYNTHLYFVEYETWNVREIE